MACLIIYTGKFVINITKRFHHLFNDLDSKLENLENSFHMSTLTHSSHQPHGFLLYTVNIIKVTGKLLSC